MCVCVCVCVCVCIYIYMHLHACMHVHIHIFQESKRAGLTSSCLYVSMCVCVLCMYVWMYQRFEGFFRHESMHACMLTRTHTHTLHTRVKNGWSGIIMYGCIRDYEATSNIYPCMHVCTHLHTHTSYRSQKRLVRDHNVYIYIYIYICIYIYIYICIYIYIYMYGCMDVSETHACMYVRHYCTWMHQSVYFYFYFRHESMHACMNITSHCMNITSPAYLTGVKHGWPGIIMYGCIRDTCMYVCTHLHTHTHTHILQESNTASQGS